MKAVYICFTSRIWLDNGQRDSCIGLVNSAYLACMKQDKTIRKGDLIIKSSIDEDLAMVSDFIFKVPFKMLGNREKATLKPLMSNVPHYLGCKEIEGKSQLIKVFNLDDCEFFIFNFKTGEIVG